MFTDPIQTIKDEEQKAARGVDELLKTNRNRLEEHRIKKERDLEQYKEELREKGQASLEKAKQEAMNRFKEISSEEESERVSVINRAQSKRNEATEKIVSFFEKNIVS